MPTAAVAALAMLAGACVLSGRERAAVDGRPQSLYLWLIPETAPRYRVGEAVVFHVALGTRQTTTQTVTGLSHGSVEFFVLPAGPDGPRHQRGVSPVFSPLEPPAGDAPVTSPTHLRRDFLFTTLTAKPGKYVLRCVYSTPEPANPDRLMRVYARPAPFEVIEDAPVLQRHSNGLITRHEALRLACEATGRPGAPADARLVVDEMGFHKWWVNVNESDAATTASVSYFVDPYQGRVWARARPFDPTVKQDDLPISLESEVIQKLRERRRTEFPTAPGR